MKWSLSPLNTYKVITMSVWQVWNDYWVLWTHTRWSLCLFDRCEMITESLEHMQGDHCVCLTGVKWSLSPLNTCKVIAVSVWQVWNDHQEARSQWVWLVLGRTDLTERYSGCMNCLKQVSSQGKHQKNQYKFWIMAFVLFFFKLGPLFCSR